MAKFVRHTQCPSCDSKDNCALYDDNSMYCFGMGCGHYESPSKEERKTFMQKVESTADSTNLIPSEVEALLARKISEETCKFFQYNVGYYNGEVVHVANYKSDKGQIIAQKIRTKDKKFKWVGQPKKVSLYGKWLWNPSDKINLIITEGELDALSVAEMQNRSWPVVSVPNGAPAAKKAIQKDIEWISKFKKVIFLFDSDDVGQAAAEECAALLSPGKAAIASMPEHDANDMLKLGKVKELQKCIWNARDYRPDGILAGSEITAASLRIPATKGYSMPYPKLDAMIRGIQKRRLTLLTAGSGIGKSTLAKELAFHLFNEETLKIGNIFLEEDIRQTALSYISMDNNLPTFQLAEDPTILTKEKFDESYDKMINNDRMLFFDHFGSLSTENLINKLEYLAIGKGVDFIILDHISIVISGLEKGSREGERKDIDLLMTALRSLIQRTGVGVIAIVHLKRKDLKKRSYNDGGQISLTDLRGSGSLEQLSDVVVGIERDQQAENPTIAKIRVLKNRVTGETGEADTVRYGLKTGRLLPDNTL